MKLLFDECVPKPPRKDIRDHDVFTIEEAGFKGLKNGALLKAAAAEYDVLITVDKNLKYQQNLKDLPVAMLLLASRSSKLERLIELLLAAHEALATIGRGELVIIED